MKKTYYVVISWRVQSPKGMYRVSSKVVQYMTGNKNFIKPAVPMDEFAESSDRLNKAIDNSGNGKAAELELKNAAASMDDMLRTQATYVTETSKNDLTVLESSGYQSNKVDITKSVIPLVPENFKVKSNNGNIVLSCKKPKGATSLCWVIFINSEPVTVSVTNLGIVLPDDAKGVMIIPAGKAMIELDGLPIGTRVTAQVLAQNPAGKSPLTVAVSAVVNQ